MSSSPRLFTEAEYLLTENAASTRHEYVNGRIYGMSGASPSHNRIVTNITRDLATQTRGRRCDVFANEMRVRVSRTGAYFYPDVTALCGVPEFEGTVVEMLLNPSVVIEVLSESTETFNRGDKFAHYRRIPSLQEYVLVAQDRPLVERHVRAGDAWHLTECSQLDDRVDLPSIGCTLRVGDLYERVEFPRDGAPTAPRLVREREATDYAMASGA